jgi:hypothetical protein
MADEAIITGQLRLLLLSREQCVWPEEPELFRRTHVSVRFDSAPLLFYNAAQLSLHDFECVMDHLFERFVGAIIHLPFIGHELVTWRHSHVDSTSIRIPFVMIMIGLFDGNIATIDVVTKSFQSC